MWPESAANNNGTQSAATQQQQLQQQQRKKKRKCRYPTKSTSVCAAEKPATATNFPASIYNLRRKRLLKVNLLSRTRPIVVIREAELERRLYRVFRLSQRQKRVDLLDLDKLYERLSTLLDKWSCPENLKAKVNKTWLENWCKKYNVEVTREQSSPASDDLPKDGFEKVLDEYDEDEVYLCFCFQFSWSSLPDKHMGAGSNVEDDMVWLLMAANRSGRHRTRVCVVGKEWRPECLSHVNMVSQPVVYAGGGDGQVTMDLFTWWFYHEFSPGALTINRKVALVAESETLLSCSSFISQETRAKVFWIKDNQSRKPAEENVALTELRIRYAKLLLSSIYVEEPISAVQSYLAQFTLKDAFPLLHKAWLTIRVESFTRAYKQLVMSKRDSATVRGIDGFSDLEQINGDGRMLLELQWMAHDLGLEITDDDLISWARTGRVRQIESNGGAGAGMANQTFKKESSPSEQIPSAAEAVEYLTKALLWMETEALDPNYLLFVRNIVLIAKQASDQFE
ncbi:tigger transposable element derived 5-like [Planococcus citri]|uniref:tigger transposable element derived 5-like n=1 Tax=Planococcus citri TaxID=170843 RepID=UPI0031F7B87D